MPSIPPASAFRAALDRRLGAVQHMGEGFRTGIIELANGSMQWNAAIWRHDPERPDLVDGGLALRERIVFTIRKSDLPDATLLFGGAQATGATIIWREMGRAFVVEHIDQETSDHIAWRFEARRAPGSDPA